MLSRPTTQTCDNEVHIPIAAVMTPHRKQPKETIEVRSILLPRIPLMGELRACAAHREHQCCPHYHHNMCKEEHAVH